MMLEICVTTGSEYTPVEVCVRRGPREIVRVVLAPAVAAAVLDLVEERAPGLRALAERIAAISAT
jgi:hypothetical protein